MRELLRKIPHPSPFGDRWQNIPLPPIYIPIEAKKGDAWFVDGGNAAILEAPHFSLQQLRAAAIHFPSKQLIQQQTKALIVREGARWLIHFEGGKTEHADGELPDAVAHARKFLEHALAQQAFEHNNGFVVLDGDDAPTNCIALQKTITTLTEKGFALSSVLTTAGPWRAQLGEIQAVKLHALARHVFLVRGATSEQIATLAAHSADAAFLGYPWGLILADRLARVSKEEAAALRIHAKANLKELATTVQLAESAIDSHLILDRQ